MNPIRRLIQALRPEPASARYPTTTTPDRPSDDAEAILISDVDAFRASLEPGDEPMLSLGDGMTVSLLDLLSGADTIPVHRKAAP